jgi:hypothetical protein
MFERGLLPDFSLQARGELDGIRGSAMRVEESTRDLRHLIWCSIDNDSSRDLDQLIVAGAHFRELPDDVLPFILFIHQATSHGNSFRCQSLIDPALGA